MTEGIAVKQTVNQTDVIDFDTLLDPALSSNGDHPNSIRDDLRKAAINRSIHLNLKNVNSIFTSISNIQLDRLFSMRHSYKSVDRLKNYF
ncbi:unnamed protein product [Rotaria sp. Silwood2]|nr:unnamed protein product [Rotaria sp. Silwood2]